MSYPQKPIDMLFEWVLSEGFVAERSADSSLIQVEIPDSGSRTMRIQADDAMGFMIISMRSSTVPEARRHEIYRILSNLNAAIPVGAWVIDESNGQLVFRVGLVAEGVAYDSNGLRATLSYVAATVSSMEGQFKVVDGSVDDILASWEREEED